MEYGTKNKMQKKIKKRFRSKWSKKRNEKNGFVTEEFHNFYLKRI